MNDPKLDPKREKGCRSEISSTSAPLPASLEPDTPTSASEHEALAKLETLSLTDVELDRLESQLRLRAAVLGWTGHPLHQPATVVLKIVAAILRERI